MYTTVTLTQTDANLLANRLDVELHDPEGATTPTYNLLAIAALHQLDQVLEVARGDEPVQVTLTEPEFRILAGLAANRLHRTRFVAFSTRRAFGRIVAALKAAQHRDR